WAMRSPQAFLVFTAITAAGLAGDLLSKHYVFKSLLNDPCLTAVAHQTLRRHGGQLATEQVLRIFQRPLLAGVKITLSTNPGVVFGLRMPSWAVLIATAVTFILVGMFFAASDRRAHSVHVALACILSGALGNLYDRLFSSVAPLDMPPIERNVRDFIDCSALYYPWVFNVADMLLVAGVALLALHWITAERRRKAGARA
ncbi:MAG: signal peptidase II, partial [Planctomycetes bacterium]|nr:signal peptidase II [Planctomycetota bacterium]